MNRVLLKGESGQLEPHFFSKDYMHKWFSEHTDDKGEVNEDIVIFNDCEVKAGDDNKFSFVLTDYSADRDKERIDPDGWDFKEYKQNPIVLWAHDSTRPAIAKLSNLQRKTLKAEGRKAIVGKVEFDEDDEFAVGIKNKVKNGYLSKGSVGFRSKKVEVLEEPDKDGVWLIHREQELYEFSIVNIPSNPNATVLDAVRDHAEITERDIITSDDLEKLVEKVASILKDKRESTLYDTIFDEDFHETSEDSHHETSGKTGRQTSELDYLFSESDEYDSLEDIINRRQ